MVKIIPVAAITLAPIQPNAHRITLATPAGCGAPAVVTRKARGEVRACLEGATPLGGAGPERWAISLLDLSRTGFLSSPRGGVWQHRMKGETDRLGYDRHDAVDILPLTG